jgi:hypothetical protein
MSKKPSDPTPNFPTPAISARKSTSKSLDLENIDMSKDGKQGDAVVSKGRSSTFVSLAKNDPEK